MPMNMQQARVISPILTQFARGFTQQELVGEALFPRVPVDASAGKVIEFGKDAFKIRDTERAPGADVKSIDTGYAGADFVLENHALEGKVPEEILRDAKQVPGIDLGQEAVAAAMASILLRCEDQQAKLAQNQALYGANNKIVLSGSDKWSDPSSKVARQIGEYREAVRSGFGAYPNTLLLGPKALAALKEHPDFLERIKYTGRDSITPEIIANVLELDRVVIGKAVYEKDGGFADMWGNVAVLAYVPKIISGRTIPSFGYTYHLRSHPLVEQAWYDKSTRSWKYPVVFERKPVLSAANAGFLIVAPGKD